MAQIAGERTQQAVEDQLGAEDLRKMNRKRLSWRGIGLMILVLLAGSFAYFLGWEARDNRPVPTRIITRYQLPRPCLSAINDANQGFDAIANFITASQTGSPDAPQFAGEYGQAHRAFARDLVACDKEHGIP